MRPLRKPLVFLAFCTTLLGAATVPKALDNRALNLQHYLEYQTEDKITLSCKETNQAFFCESHDQELVENDANTTTVTAFKKALFRFNAALAIVLQKEHFEAVMKELEQTRQLRQKYLASKKPYLVPPSSPLQDALDRALVGNLEQIHVDDLDVRDSMQQSRLSVRKLSYVNAMKRSAKDVTFAERILGRVDLTYTDAYMESNGTDSAYRTLTRMLEAWLDTDNTERADYVGGKLETLYRHEMRSPYSGTMSLKTRYLGNDAIGLDLFAQSANKKGAATSFAFSGELRNASTLFPPARKPPSPGSPDFLFLSLESNSSVDGSAYRAALKQDSRFAGYIRQYETLVRARFDEKSRKFSYSPVLTGWLKQAKDAFSKGLRGEADGFRLSIRNKKGTTATQLLGLLMEQLIITQPGKNAQHPDTEKIIADTAASHFEVRIEAH